MVSRTSIAGALAAVGTAVAALNGIPNWLRAVAIVLTASGTALLGLWAADANIVKPPPSFRLFLLIALLVVTAAAGCTLAGLTMDAKHPTFGTYGFALTGGSIGRASNQPPATISITNKP